MSAIEDFCGSPFWDLNLTWYTSDPDFTPCFEKTVLTWIPCGFLWVFLASDVYCSVRSSARNVPWSPLNITKYIMTGLLIVGEAVKLVFSIQRQDQGYPVETYMPIMKIVTYVAYVGLLHFSRQRGVRSSGVQFLFWLLHALCESITFRTVIRNDLYDQPREKVLYVVHTISYPLILGQLLLNCWADVGPLQNQTIKTKTTRSCPESDSSYLNRILFSWFDDVAWKGFRKPLDFKDLWKLKTEDSSRFIVPLFDKYWAKNLNKHHTKAEAKRKGNPIQLTKRNEKDRNSASIPATLFAAFGGTFLFGAALKIIPDLLAFVNPQILNLLLDFVKSDEPLWKGILYSATMFIIAVLQSIINSQYFYRMYLTGMWIRTALISAIYRKTLLISTTAKKEFSVGETVNLMSVDVQRLMDFIPFVNTLWSGILQITVSLYFLWGILGPSVLSGLGVMILLIPINSTIAAKVRNLQSAQMKNKDQRVQMMNEILTGVKVLKLYAWEPSFSDQVLKIRHEELETLRRTAYLNAVTNFLLTCAPALIALSTFATYVLIDPRNLLDPQKVFVSITLFKIMNTPMTFLPMTTMLLVQALVSIKRLNRYMIAEEIDPDGVSHESSEGNPIIVENGTFSWVNDIQVLQNIDFRVKEGELVAVVGAVGSGKSSLLAAILGELKRHNGRVNTKGSIAYAAQQAWIQNATLQDNILFGQPFDSTKYDEVISACALKTDLGNLPGRDLTEIGEKGINLSGGQKQRVSVARAIYKNADVYLFDDPLSAVDSHVGKHIFDRVLGPRGMLKRKTRVLVTHGISFLPQCDNIFVMKDGKINEFGTYQELLDKKGAFAEFLMQQVTESDEIDDIDDPINMKDIEGVVGPIQELRAKHRKNDGGVSEGEVETTTELSSNHPRCSAVSKDSVDARRKSKDLANRATLIEAEKKETESVKLSIYLEYFKAAGWGMSISAFLLYLLFQGFSVGSNFWLSAWSNEPLVNGTISTSRRDMYLGVYGTLGILQAVSILFGSFFMFLGTLKSAQFFHSRMLAQILHAPMSFFDTTPVGRIVNRFSKDLDIADNLLPQNFQLWLKFFFEVASAVVVISYSTPIFVVVVVPVGVLYYFVQKIYISSTRQLKRLESVTRSPIYSHFSETISGASTIRAYGDQQRFILESEAKCDHNQASYFPSVIANRWLQIRLETIGNSIIFFASLFVVLGRETLSPGLVGLSVSYALQITIALNMFVRWTSEVETNIVAIERLHEYIEAPQEAPWDVPSRKPPVDWPHQGVVEFKHLQARYREGLDLVIRNVSCRIESGEKIGIVGRTGAGKSSLTLALFRIIEAASGSIEIDGRDISELGLHDVRGRLTIIPQDPVLFLGTLRVNLDPFGMYSDETIWRALELAHLQTDVRELAAGLQHKISEGGKNLSVGQRQLVCLARALLRRTKILVLDEATGAVDLRTDDLIQQTIRREFQDSTVITIAHRLNTIMDSSRVMVLDHGQIREFDSPANLLETRNSLFYAMVKDAGFV